jgi:hypothetical protein
LLKKTSEMIKKMQRNHLSVFHTHNNDESIDCV